MTSADGILLGVAWVLTAATLPGTIELAFLTLGGVLFRPVRGSVASPPGEAPRPRVAVLVPAHDEEVHIVRCVESLLACRRQGRRFDVVVVADNCRDATAALARAAGARVIERVDPEHRGKGFALAYGFDRLLEEGVTLVAVVDADSVVSPNFVAAIESAVNRGALAVQVRYLVGGAGSAARDRLLRLGVVAFNVIRPRARAWAGMSAGLLGNGFALTREALRRVPFAAWSLVEDLEYHVALLRAGVRVTYVDVATVVADVPVSDDGRCSQRVRWEGGRLNVAGRLLPQLVRELLCGRFALAEPILELLLLPLAWHALLLGVLLALPHDPTRAYAVVAGVTLGAHVLAAVHATGRPADLLVLCEAPRYLIWKLARLPAIVRHARPGARWVRTGRTAQGVEDPGPDRPRARVGSTR